ncbi:hypothetical protein NT2_23_00070 [Caenibius tardaugens NBRC 16725]|uniref:LamG domain-containing protein n=2 Tax=Caenibius TaxID=2827482 RepID=U2YQB5_9SPHN|nr:hypothetical protein NT2_23_00070 [Caenibius tardaugens NBRC 16725]
MSLSSGLGPLCQTESSSQRTDSTDQVDKRSAAVMRAAKPRSSYVYWGKGISIPGDHASRLTGSFAITADIDSGHAPANGVLAALGGHFAGWSFFLRDGYPIVVMAGSTQASRIYRVAGGEAVPSGASNVRYAFVSDGGPGKGGTMTISINDRVVGSGRIEQPIVMTTELSDTFDVGFDSSTPVTDEYTLQGRFTGDIRKLEVLPGS